MEKYLTPIQLEEWQHHQHYLQQTVFVPLEIKIMMLALLLLVLWLIAEMVQDTIDDRKKRAADLRREVENHVEVNNNGR